MATYAEKYDSIFNKKKKKKKVNKDAKKVDDKTTKKDVKKKVKKKVNKKPQVRRKPPSQLAPKATPSQSTPNPLSESDVKSNKA